MKCFDEFITEAVLVDLPLVGKKYTWYKIDGKCMSRLDKFLVLNAWLSHWPHTTQWGLSRSVSDHCAILLKNEDINWGPKPFRVLDCWRGDARYAVFVRSQWKELDVEGRVTFVLKEKLKLLKCRLLEVVQRKEWRAQLCASLTLKDNLLFQKSRLNWLQARDANSKFFHACINCRRLKNEIRSLKVANERYNEPSTIKEEVKGFFEGNFRECLHARPRLQGTDFKTLSEEDVVTLILPFSDEEVKNAVWDCEGSKSPGPDGFNFTFIKDFWDDIKGDFLAF
uniref:Uncharacterized protein n=1 Tax=Cajanus cajan TaxID=3821 RepID=A0A151S1C9_CAJCA|nr:hypothetical protein KK1_029682 [Cajanus cajan]